MIESTFYLSNHDNIELAQEITGLAFDELEQIVGRFRKDHYRFAGQLKGEVIQYYDGKIKIRHHFTKKVLWNN